MTKLAFPVSRRAFLRVAAVAGVAAALPPRSSRAADARIDVLASEPIGPVTADLYGHPARTPETWRGRAGSWRS